MICCTFTQLVKPGSPVILGNFLSSMSLKSGASTFGMPEPAMSHFAIAQLARRLNLPVRCGGSLTAAKIADAQAAESADSMMSMALAGTHFTLQAAGWLEGGLCTGYEKMVIDADRLVGGYQVMLASMETGDEALGRGAYEDVEPAVHFLGSAHTMANCETAFYDAVMSDSESCEKWEERGSKDTERRAYERWNALLNEYEAPEIDPGIDEALKDYVARKKAGVEDAWY